MHVHFLIFFVYDLRLSSPQCFMTTIVKDDGGRHGVLCERSEKHTRNRANLKRMVKLWLFIVYVVW